MIILSIDTSCDDTSVAIVEKTKGKITILSNIISSQVKLHQEYGGVYPSLARREHQKNLVFVLKKSLKKAGFLEKGNSFHEIKNQLKREQDLKENLIRFLKTYQKPKIDAIAVTCGPGLEPCLWVGINFTLALGHAWNLPLIAVNHIEGHILASVINKKVEFPALALVVSGGHTQLVLIKQKNNYKVIGETRDDAAGECFDKTARILGLPYPGGPIISSLAETTKKAIEFPRPMLHSNDFDFSFSGLKTAVLYHSQKNKITETYKKEAARGIENAIVDVLITKTKKAVKKYKIKTVIAGGGVLANKNLRKNLKKEFKNIFLPEKKLCTDNAAMIGITALFHLQYKQRIRARSNLRL